MPTIVCLETQDREVFVNLGQICQATVTSDQVEIWYANGKSDTFYQAAAHLLIQALRHQERITSARNR